MGRVHLKDVLPFLFFDFVFASLDNILFLKRGQLGADSFISVLLTLIKRGGKNEIGSVDSPTNVSSYHNLQ